MTQCGPLFQSVEFAGPLNPGCIFFFITNDPLSVNVVRRLKDVQCFVHPKKTTITFPRRPVFGSCHVLIATYNAKVLSWSCRKCLFLCNILPSWSIWGRELVHH